MEPAGQEGMSLRDWFAGQMLAGMAAYAADSRIPTPADRASACYLFADAMLAARALREKDRTAIISTHSDRCDALCAAIEKLGGAGK